jgi:hypothetical protein
MRTFTIVTAHRAVRAAFCCAFLPIHRHEIALIDSLTFVEALVARALGFRRAASANVVEQAAHMRLVGSSRTHL